MKVINHEILLSNTKIVFMIYWSLLSIVRPNPQM